MKEYAPVTHLHYLPIAPYDLAVTSSTRIQIYSLATNALKKSLARFENVAYSGSFRADGKLLCAGSEDGAVRIFDLGSRAILRTLSGHAHATHAACFSASGLRVFSASDDASARLWDMATGAQVALFQGHEDYVRTGLASPASSDIWLTGSYDRTVRLWDARTQACVLSMQHGDPIRAAVVYPSGGVVVVASGNDIYVWDVLAGGRLLQRFSNHQKTITALTFDAGCSRLLSASLDQLVKVYDTRDYRVIHSSKYAAPILSLGLSPDGTHLAVGMANSMLSMRRRPIPAAEAPRSSDDRAQLRGGTYRYFMRGQGRKPSPVRAAASARVCERA